MIPGPQGRNSPSFSAYAASSNGLASPVTPVRSVGQHPSLAQRSHQVYQQHSTSSQTRHHRAKPSVEESDQSRELALSHWKLFDRFLREGNRDPPSQHSNARDKLTRLTRQQFRELSTDVYDELVRRQVNKGSTSYDSRGNPIAPEPFLPVQPEFHDKRNQARQKLSTLASSRFRDLAGDVYYELSRRYPEFSELADSSPPPAPTPTVSQPIQERKARSPPPASTAANDVVVPNKSTLVEEDINAPNEYHDKQVRDSTVSSEVNQKWDNDEVEKLRADYELKIASLQSRVNQLEKDLDTSKTDAKTTARELEKTKKSEWDLRNQLGQIDEQAQTIRNLQREISELQASNDDMTNLRKGMSQQVKATAENQETIRQLRAETRALVEQLQSVTEQHNTLSTERDANMEKMEKLQDQAALFKRKFESTRQELREAKETSSSSFISTTAASIDQMTFSQDGAIQDTNVNAFQSAIDNLLTAGRSNTPSSVLPAMKSLVLSVSKIDQDVQAFERDNIDSIALMDQEKLHSLKVNCNQTLSNLMTAARNHATSQGVSPISLLDAAASHLVVTVVDIIKLLLIRRTPGGAAENNNTNTTNHRANNLSVDDGTSPIMRSDSASSFRNNSNLRQQQYSPLPRSESNRSDRLLPTHVPGERSFDSQSGGGLSRTTSPQPYHTRDASISPTSATTQGTAPLNTSRSFPNRTGGSFGQDNKRPVPAPLNTNGISRSKSPSITSPYLGGGSGAGSASTAASGRQGSLSASTGSLRTQQQQQQLNSASSMHSRRDGSAASATFSGSMRSGGNTPRAGGGYGGDYDKELDDAINEEPEDDYDDHTYTRHNRQASYGGGGGDSPASDQQLADYDQSPRSRMEDYPSPMPNGLASGGDAEENGYDDDESWEELKSYFETQTEEIVRLIKNMLPAMQTAGTQQGPKISEDLAEIISTVSSIIDICRDSVQFNERVDSGTQVLDYLAENRDKLAEMQGRKELVFNKSARQTISSASYGIAKSLKSIKGLISPDDNGDQLT